MVDTRSQEILKTLREAFSMPKWTTSTCDPFRMLIVTIISQNTNDRNTEKAFKNLSNKFRIDPETLGNAKALDIQKNLEVAGLYRNKSKAIKQVSQIILEKYHGNMKQLLSLPLEDARRELLQLPGVGPKTADVVLLFSAGKPTIPIDTHVNRVSKRLGLAPEDGGYEIVRAALQSLYDPRDYFAVHILLILHGRRYCRARTPLCEECPVSSLCQAHRTS